MSKSLFVFLVFLLSCSFSYANSIHDIKLAAAQGDEVINFSTFKGSVLLVVNIATRCGYTGQLEGLESLYKEYKDKGLQIIGIPSNSLGPKHQKKTKKSRSFVGSNTEQAFQ